MGAGRDALVVIGADVSAVKAAAAEAVSAWKDVGRSISSELGNATASIINDLGRVVTAQGQVSFSSQHQQVREFEAATARMAVATGRDLGAVRSAAEATGIEIGKRPGEVQAWATEVGRLTGNFQGAEKSIRGFAGLAAATNRSVDDYRGLAVELVNVGHVAGDSTHALGVMTAQAQMLGTVGGPAALADQVLGLQDVISHFAVKGEADFLRITAAAAVFGKGLNQAASARVQQQILGTVSNINPYLMKRMLGHSVVDEHGQMKDAIGTAFELRDYMVKKYGRERAVANMSMMGMSYEGASALVNANRNEVTAAAGAKPSAINEAAVKAYLGTDAGKRDVAQAELSASSRQLLGSSTALGRAADALQKFTATHPIVGTFSATAAAGLTGAIATAVGKSVTFAIRAGLSGGAGGGSGGAGGGAGGGKSGGWGSALPLIGMGLAADAAITQALGSKKLDHGMTWGDVTNDYGVFDESKATSAVTARKLEMMQAFQAENAALAQSGLSDAEKKKAGAAATSVFAMHPELAGGGQGTIAALVAELRKMGQSDAASDKIAKVLDDRLRNLTIEVSSTDGTPITATANAGHSTSAGSQAHP